MGPRYIVIWRKPPPGNILEWDHHPCFDLDEVKEVIKNIKAQGAKQYRSYTLGDRVDEFSSDY